MTCFAETMPMGSACLRAASAGDAGAQVMFKRVILASDGSQESLVALREGALIARAFRAKVFLLIIEREGAGVRLADGVYPVPRGDDAPHLLQRGLDRLARIGVGAAGEVVVGEPATVIGACARNFAADLVVVGHRRQSLLDRWWSGSSGAYLVDNVTCSVLIARNIVSDEEFEAVMAQAEAPA
jgi:nucleotide-binding universal stress UspA family protein